ncbi:MAG: hypothetical protein IKM18_00245 [Clostridia bacterium]|jgi:hypothetical protein|nr:hypothetical protein [Clostridia bacterium]
MSIKAKISNMIQDYVRNYDFEEMIEDAFDDIDLEGIIENRIKNKIEDVDITPLLTDLIKDYIDEELMDIDIEDDVLTALQDQFE